MGTDSAPIVIGISGASGAPIAVRVLRAIADAGRPVEVVVSAGGLAVLREEVDWGAEELGRHARAVYRDPDLGVPIASGSVRTAGMAVVPCSSSTVAKVATGIGDTLLTRVAHVHLKERRPLVLVPRETPLDAILLGQMTRLAELGAVLLVASPPYYTHPRTVEDQTDYLAGKVLDHLGVPHTLYRPWEGPSR